MVAPYSCRPPHPRYRPHRLPGLRSDSQHPHQRGASHLAPARPLTSLLLPCVLSGKTTLLNHILHSESHRMRIAVIENEYGEVGIDQGLIKVPSDAAQADEELIEMNNGCICCTVRGDLIQLLKKLHKKSRRASVEKRIQHVLIETTGLADPGPVAQTFFVDDNIQQLYRLEGIVTVVDAFHIQTALANSPQAQQQIAFADCIVLNKVDLVPETAQLDQLGDADPIDQCGRHHPSHSAVRHGAAAIVGHRWIQRQPRSDCRPAFFQPEQPFEYAAAYHFDQAGDYRLHLPVGPDSSMKIAFFPVLPSSGMQKHSKRIPMWQCRRTQPLCRPL